MELFTSLAAVPDSFGPSAVTIGKFDGVHAGHRQVISELLSVADTEGLVPAVVTFDRNPLSVLRPESCPSSLLSNAQKVERLAEVGVATTVMLPFDREFSQQTPEQFVRTILVDTLHARVVLIGSDFRFGARGAGDLDLLTELGREHGFEVRLIDDLRPRDGRRASSTWIRELLAEGRVDEATELLGHAPTVRARVVHGSHRGRELGYPTANLSPDLEGYIPADGVYAAWFDVDGTRYPAAVSIGNNPTFTGVPEKQIEAHLLDQQIDLYGRLAEISFVQFIRGMVKFEGVDALVAQMHLDEQEIRGILGVPGESRAAVPGAGGSEQQ